MEIHALSVVSVQYKDRFVFSTPSPQPSRCTVYGMTMIFLGTNAGILRQSFEENDSKHFRVNSQNSVYEFYRLGLNPSISALLYGRLEKSKALNIKINWQNLAKKLLRSSAGECSYNIGFKKCITLKKI